MGLPIFKRKEDTAVLSGPLFDAVDGMHSGDKCDDVPPLEMCTCVGDESVSFYPPRTPVSDVTIGTHRTVTYTTEDVSEWGTETRTHVVTYDEDDDFVDMQITTDEETSKPFRIFPVRQDIMSAIESAGASGHKRVQINMARRYGKSRMGRELQRRPSLLPTFLGEGARVLIVTSGWMCRYYPDHMNCREDVDPETLRSYDAVILDEILGADFIHVLPDMPVIYFGTTPRTHHGFHRVHVGRPMNARGWAI